MSVDHAREDIVKVGVGLDAIELAVSISDDTVAQRVAAAVASGEQVVLATERDRPDSALDRVGVELDAAILEEPA